MALGAAAFGKAGDAHAAAAATVSEDGPAATSAPDAAGTARFDNAAVSDTATPSAQRAGSVSRLDGTYVLEVIVNGESTGRIGPFLRRKGRWFVRAGDLRLLGLTSPQLPPRDATDVALDSLDGVRATYDAAHQTLALQVGDAWLTPYALGRAPPVFMAATSGTGVLINYDGYVQRDRFTRASVWSEVRGFWPGGTVRQTGLAEHSAWRHGYRRYDTWWQHDDPARLTTWVAGDLITGSLAWTRSLRIAGLQWRRNFSLRPDLVTFPIPTLHGSAVVPSSVDVYLDGVRRMSGHVPPGPFRMPPV